MKKKLLIICFGSTLVSFAALAISIPLSISSNKEFSDTTDTQKPSDNSNNPSTTLPIVTTKKSSISITSYNLTKSDLSSVNDNVSFNTYLSTAFDVSKLFGTYDNVDISYVDNSANYLLGTFSIKAIPTENSEWEDGTRTEKTYEVILNITNSTCDATSAFSDEYIGTINVGNGGTNKDIISKLKEDNNFKNNLVNYSYDKYKNVSIEIIDNSGNISNKTFQLKVTPILGHKWIDNTFSSRIINVNISNLITNWDSTVPTLLTDKFIGFFDNIIIDDLTFSDAITQYFKTKTIKESLQFSSIYKNVNLEYVEKSASFSQKAFSIKATPIKGHAWVDGTTNEKNIRILVKLSDFSNSINTSGGGTIGNNGNTNVESTQQESKSITLPTNWSIDATTYKNTYYSNGSQKDFETIAKIAFNDMSVSFPGIQYVGVNASEPSGQITIISANVNYFWIKIKLKSGYVWADGTPNSKTKNIRIFLFSSNVSNLGSGSASNNNSLNSLIVKDLNGLPSERWISNFIWEMQWFKEDSYSKNVDLLFSAILNDLKISFPKWNVSISNLKPFSKKTNTYADVWIYKITFISKTNSNIAKTINGYQFTRYA